MAYIDIHTHRQSTEFPTEMVAFCNYIVENAEDSTTGTIGFDGLYSAGIHPWYIHDNGICQLKKLEEIARQPTIYMIGEAGLDKLIATPLAIQIKIFEAQAALAETLQKPLVIHCVKTWQELFEVHRRLRPTMPWLIHGFRGKGDLARQLVRKGYYLSFGIHFHPASVQAAWPDRLFAETDEAPDSIQTVYRQLSTAIGCPLSVLTAQIECNLKNFIQRDHTYKNG